MFFLAFFNLMQVQGWIEGGGYLVVFGLLFACGLGLPLPEDIPLIIAGALVARGQMHLLPAAIASWLGIIGGDLMLYHLGKKFGMEITRVPFVGKHVTRARIQQVEHLFSKYGVGVIGVGRLLAGVRGAMVIAAGAIRYNLTKFIIADGLAALVSGGLWMALGHWLGNNLTETNIRKFKEWFIGAAVLLAIAAVVWILWKRRHPSAVAELDVKIVEKAAKVAESVAVKMPLVSKPKTSETAGTVDAKSPAK